MTLSGAPCPLINTTGRDVLVGETLLNGTPSVAVMFGLGAKGVFIG